MSINPLILALDVPAVDRAIQMASQLKGHLDVLKVGYPLFIQGGPSFVESLMHEGFHVFLDLKFHDIPNTVANAIKSTATLNPFMLTLHTSGGLKMMEAAVKARNDAQVSPKDRTILVGVTVLTSIDHIMLGRELRVMGSVEAHVSELAWMAKQCGLDGVVASSHEIAVIRQRCGREFTVVVPGIRPGLAASTDDQKRTMTPHEAIKRGADYLVIGRPILEAPDPVRAARDMSEEVRGALALSRGGNA